jgi:hypothetical protein
MMFVENINSSFGSVANRFVQALVGQQLERLVADLREAHVGHAADAAARQRGNDRLEVVHVRDKWVDNHDELGAALDCHVHVGGRADATVDQLAPLELDRLVDHGQRGRGLDRARDRHVVPIVAAEDDALASVEIRCRQVELAVEHPEVIGPIGIAEHVGDVVLDALAVVEARREALGEADRQVHERDLAQLADQRARHADHPQGHQRKRLRELERVRPHQRGAIDVAERGGHLTVDHAHHLFGRDAVGREGRDERAGAGAHVDVELVDRLVDGQQVERAEGADFVDAACESAAAEHQGRARFTPAPLLLAP